MAREQGAPFYVLILYFDNKEAELSASLDAHCRQRTDAANATWNVVLAITIEPS